MKKIFVLLVRNELPSYPTIVMNLYAHRVCILKCVHTIISRAKRSLSTLCKFLLRHKQKAK